MKKTKRLTAVILSALMMTSAFSALPVSAAVSESNISSVSANDTLTSGDYKYSVLDDGTVEISKYVGSDSDVTIPNVIDGKKVTSIGKNAFVNCNSLISILIPNTVTTIGASAFYNCINLEEILISDSVTNIGVYAFTNTAWYNNQPNGMIIVGKVLYEYKGNMPENTELIIPKGIVSITAQAFFNRSNLVSIVIPDGVTSIGSNAFDFCSNLKNISIPESIISIGSLTFDNTAWYDEQPDGMIFVGKVLYKYKGNTTENVIIPDGIITIQDDAFWGKSLKKIYIPRSVESIGNNAFDLCGNLVEINVDKNNNKYSSLDGVLFNKEQDILIKCPNKETYIVPNSVVSIGKYAFNLCVNLKSLSITNGVTNINEYAFQYCENLVNVLIPNSVTTIGSGAFEYCENLESINIPYGIKSIEYGTFQDCSNLVNITIPETVTSIGYHAFEGCMRLENILIPDSVVYIGRYAFNCTEWYDNQPDGIVFAGKVLYNYKGDMPKNTNIIIPNGTKAISPGAFSECVNLRSISIPNSISNISSDMFSGCTDLTNVSIPNTVTEIGNSAFYYCTSLKDINIPNSVTSIENSAFYYCTSLENIVIPVGTKSIGSNAFYGCSNLSSVTIPNTVTNINALVFGNCTKLKSIVIPESIDTIEPFAFVDCTSLKTIIIPKNVNFLGHNCIGYYYDEDSHDYLKIENFKIYGYKNTAAEKYAQDNGFEFISLADDIIFSDKSTGITVSGVMQDDAVLNVTKLENTFENSFATYDITLQKDGAVIQPDGTITVKIPSNAENCKVMWLKDDGTTEDMNAKYTDGCYVFTTDHLSVYALVQDKTILTGDANQDGIINVNDVTYLQMHIAGNKNTDGSALIDETNKQLFDCVDMNKDGKLSVADVTELQFYISNNS